MGRHKMLCAWVWCVYLKLKITQQIDLNLIYETQNININAKILFYFTCLLTAMIKDAETLSLYRPS
jgi:hypothetical protein